MNKRIFIALKISEELQTAIMEREAKWGNLPVRWIKGKNLHITVIPPWYVQDIQPVINLLKTLEGATGDIEMKFDTVCPGPDPFSPRLIWTEGRTPEKLPLLKKKLELLLKLKPEKRPFLLHLTLARFKQEDFKDFPNKKFRETVDWKDTAASLVLMESKLSPSGADYDVLAEFKL
jgi:2'-5' RNA ligase